MFIEYLQSDPLLFFSVVATIVVSITLHELAHGYTAVALGDDTPIRQKRLTLNPLVHMGLWSIIAMLIMGIAWGSMPINPSRLRGRFGEALVALAGPVTNVLLALIALTWLALWQAHGAPVGQTGANWQMFLRVFGVFNVALAIFNMLPIPPFDGSGVLDGFIPGFRRKMMERVNPMVIIAIVFVAFSSLEQTGYGLFSISYDIAYWWMHLVR